MIVRYQPGEKEALRKELMARLNTGPVIIWTPYAAALDKGRMPWRHVRSIDANTAAVGFRPHMTHSVVVNLEREPGQGVRQFMDQRDLGSGPRRRSGDSGRHGRLCTHRSRRGEDPAWRRAARRRRRPVQRHLLEG